MKKRTCAFVTLVLSVLLSACALSGPVQIREANAIVKFAGLFTGDGGAVAVTIGNTVYVLPEFRNDNEVICHELVHIAQKNRVGRFKFHLYYLWETILSGYKNNKYEVEARESSASNCRQLPEGHKWSGWSLDPLSFFGYHCDAFFPARVQGCPSSIP